jgi:hypothetical protein
MAISNIPGLQSRTARVSPHSCSLFLRYDIGAAKWCTVTTLDGDGKRYSLDVLAESSFDAAHLS